MKCFIISFKKIALAGVESRFLQIPGIFEARQRLAGVTLAVGQRQNSAIRVARPTTRPAATVCQAYPAIQKEHRWYRRHSRTEVNLCENCSPKPVIDPKTESLGPIPALEWPDADGFYAALVLRQVRARFQLRWKSTERMWSVASTVDGGRPMVAAKSARAKLSLRIRESLIVAEVASARVLGEPFETLLTQLAQRRVQLPVSGKGHL